MAKHSTTTKNAWGGEDYRGATGIAMTSVEDETTTVRFLTTNEVLVWQASFSSATPDVVVRATLEQARRQADGRK